MNPETLLSLTAYAFVTSITPGPNNAMLLASGVNFGLKRTLPHILGVTLGFAVMQLALGLGVGLAFEAWPPLFTVLRVAGAAYMLYLAWRIASATPPPAPVSDGSAASPASPSARPRPGSSRARPMTFMEASAFQWVNPKAVLMCVGAASAFMPQDRPVLGILVISAVFLAMGLPCQGAWAALGTALRGLLADRTRLRAFNVAMALLLAASLVPMLQDLARDLAPGLTRPGLF